MSWERDLGLCQCSVCYCNYLVRLWTLAQSLKCLWWCCTLSLPGVLLRLWNIYEGTQLDATKLVIMMSIMLHIFMIVKVTVISPIRRQLFPYSKPLNVHDHHKMTCIRPIINITGIHSLCIVTPPYSSLDLINVTSRTVKANYRRLTNSMYASLFFYCCL